MGITLDELERMASIAQERANESRLPYMVCWQGKSLILVAAPQYQLGTHGTVERLRYPAGYLYPREESGKRW